MEQLYAVYSAHTSETGGATRLLTKDNYAFIIFSVPDIAVTLQNKYSYILFLDM